MKRTLRARCAYTGECGGLKPPATIYPIYRGYGRYTPKVLKVRLYI